MGLLERWDRRNQRILEYHNAIATDWQPRLDSRRVVLLVAVWLVSRVGAEVVAGRWGAWAATGAGVVLVVVLVVSGVILRRRRLAWEATREERSS